uniref:Uncharacterized protein n=1 Tax=Anguilla anguilla TaxID=7936 RepID=A0A0E9RHS6_ANGAN
MVHRTQRRGYMGWIWLNVLSVGLLQVDSIIHI